MLNALRLSICNDRRKEERRRIRRQKTANEEAKGRLLACKRRPFAMRNVCYCKSISYKLQKKVTRNGTLKSTTKPWKTDKTT